MDTSSNDALTADSIYDCYHSSCRPLCLSLSASAACPANQLARHRAEGGGGKAASVRPCERQRPIIEGLWWYRSQRQTHDEFWGSGSIRISQIHLVWQIFAAVKPAVIYPFHFFSFYFESEVSRAPGKKKQTIEHLDGFYLHASKHKIRSKMERIKAGRGCAVNPNLNESRGEQHKNNKEWMAASS